MGCGFGFAGLCLCCFVVVVVLFVFACLLACLLLIVVVVPYLSVFMLVCYTGLQFVLLACFNLFVVCC